MANFSSMIRRIGVAKETTRGTAESSPGLWVAVDPSSSFDFKRVLYPDIGLRGVMSQYASVAGVQEGDWKILMPARASDVGEFLHMLIGDPVSAQQGGTTAYLHTFTPANTLLPQSYTLFVDRSMNVLKHAGGNVANIKISSKPDDFVMFEATGMFLKEASGSIGSPSYSESAPMTLQHVTIKLAGTSNTEIKDWEVNLSNGLYRKFVTAQLATPEQLVAIKNSASGSFTIFFEDVTERDKFVAGTTSSFELICTGDVISGAYSYTIEVLCDDIRYTAFPYGEEDGLLAAKVTWTSFYSSSNTRVYRARITNTNTAY